jgi:hypothetical protein
LTRDEVEPLDDSIYKICEHEHPVSVARAQNFALFWPELILTQDRPKTPGKRAIMPDFERTYDPWATTCSTPRLSPHTRRWARLTLAPVDYDAGRIDQGMQEVVAGGMSTALAVIALLAKHLGVSLVAAHGVETTRALLHKTILDAGEAVDDLP